MRLSSILNLLYSYCRERRSETVTSWPPLFAKKRPGKKEKIIREWGLIHGLLQEAIVPLIPVGHNSASCFPALCTLHTGSSWRFAIPRRRWHRWVCVGEANPPVNTPHKINNNNIPFFPKAPSYPDRTSSKCDRTGLKYISFIVNMIPHSLIRSAGCLSAICSLPRASTCQHKLQHWLSNDWQNIFPPVQEDIHCFLRNHHLRVSSTAENRAP